MGYTEDRAVERPIIAWLQELGWRYVPSDGLRREIEEPFDLPTLEAATRRLNPVVIQTDEDVEQVINQLRRVSNDISGNREFFEWLKGERSIVLKQGEKAQTIRLIDPDYLENNSFVVTNQFKFSGYENVRFDIVLMVNGIPLVLIEAKIPTKEQVDYHEAIRQILRYNREAPQFFKHLALTCATDGMSFRYDWTFEDKYFVWKGREYFDPLENSVKVLFRREFLIDFVNNFIVFEKEREQVRKKMAMYQQLTAANKIVQRVLEGKMRSGLIWHTQGSGKSLTMLFAAWKLKKAPQLNNPTILLVVDRIDLERQLWGSFSNVDLPYTAKAESTKDLVNKLKKESREVIITTIQKFEEVGEILSQRENIIVFVDEAHRSQYGQLAMKMRRAFPNAFIFGFTGTPIEKGALGKSTFRAFCPPGELYLDKYGIKQSIEDGATVRLLYQPRLAEFHLDRETLDREFFEITRDLPEEEQENVLQRSVNIKNALKSKDRVDKVAKDVAEHYRSHVEPSRFKAQLVAVDREACALYKEALDRYLPTEYSSVIYTASPNDDTLLRKYNMDKEDQLNIARITFQKPDEYPKILIVTDMLLTGFDAPIEQVMYLDKPMRDHKLLQAIARTNRPYPEKEAGIIVDYVGIFRNLVKALNFEEQDIEGVAYDFGILRQEFERTLSNLLKLFQSVKRDGTHQSLMNVMEILSDPDNLKEFKQKLSQLKRLYETLAPDPVLFQYLDYYVWLIEINEAYRKFYNRAKPDLSSYEAKTKQLIMETVLLEKLETELPIFEINKDYLKNLEDQKYSEDGRIKEMRQALQHHIMINLEANPIYETLSQRLERILETHEKHHLIRELELLVKDVVKVEDEAQQKGLSREEFAVFNAVKKYRDIDEKEIIEFTRQTLKHVKGEVFRGWQRKFKVVNEVEKLVFDRCYQRFFKDLGPRDTSRMYEEIMRLVSKYNS